MQIILMKRCVIALGKNSISSCKYNTVGGDMIFIKGIVKTADAGRRDAGLLRCTKTHKSPLWLKLYFLL